MDGGTGSAELGAWDRERYPRTAAYLASLPADLDSFPECKGKASVLRKVYEYSDLRLSGLPIPLQLQLDRPAASTTWCPQALVLAGIVAMVESRGLNTASESAWIREAATYLFASPMYKILMWAATPRLVLKSANLRWSAFFRGSSLSSEVTDRQARVTLECPDGLFNRDLAEIFEHVLFAALNYTKDVSQSTQLELDSFSPGEIHYAARY